MATLGIVPRSAGGLLDSSGKGPAGAAGRGARVERWVAGRPRRVVLLLVAVLLMSLGDLYMTLTYLLNVGMLEGNPIARAVMVMDRPGLLIGWKVVSLGLGLGILYWARRSRNGELGAWVCFVLLSWLTVHWSSYNAEVVELTPAIAEMGTLRDHRWVTMAGG
ncbi:MAG: hypothetical protein IT436_02545 [Phycisphaerales bacterium]|nr:hypothetical protein [Phycisphaerales bacterium]